MRVGFEPLKAYTSDLCSSDDWFEVRTLVSCRALLSLVLVMASPGEQVGCLDFWPPSSLSVKAAQGSEPAHVCTEGASRGNRALVHPLMPQPWPLPFQWVPPAQAWGRAEVKPCSFGSLVAGRIPHERLQTSQKFYWNTKRVGAALIIVLTWALGGLYWLHWPR